MSPRWEITVAGGEWECPECGGWNKVAKRSKAETIKCRECATEVRVAEVLVA